MIHGGYLTAINAIAKYNTLPLSVINTYSDWIRGDVLKRGKQERYLKEILSAIIARYNKQVSWHALADSISIESHKTVSDYCELLSQMDALFIQYALDTNKLLPAPKKARKLSFSDPFVYHAIKVWLNPTPEPYEKMKADIANPTLASELVEGVVSNHFARHTPTYYLKHAQEVDIAYLKDNKIWPIEVKWRSQLRPKEIKHLLQYPNSKIYAKTNNFSMIEDKIPLIPIAVALYNFDQA